MRAAFEHGPSLPWSRSVEEEQRYWSITRITFLLALLFGLAVPLIELPERDRFERPPLPPRVAKLVLEQRQVQPRRPAPPQVQKPAPKKAKPAKTQAKPAPVKPTPKQPAPTAREKAAASGLLAFTDELAELRQAPQTTTQRVEKLGAAAQSAQQTERSLITSKAAEGSSGISVSQVSRNGAGGGLGQRSTTRMSGSGGGSGGSGTGSASGTGGSGTGAGGAGSGSGQGGGRSREEIQLVFDRNKGAIYALYNRALRNDPGLQGKAVVELSIAPSGKVTACRILSSELHNKELEDKLVARIKLFKFLEKDVDTVVVSYPIDFLPS